MLKHMRFYERGAGKQFLGILLLIILLSYIILEIFPVESKASYTSKFKDYPGYEMLIKDLQVAHPNWEFEILETGLDWADFIKNETTAKHGRNVTNKNYGEWYCRTCGNKKQYEKGWYCASETTVAYYMDPRNSLFEDYIFQFEQLTYDDTIQTKAGVETIISDCNYLQGNIKYYDPVSKTTKTMEKTYADAIMEAAKKWNISPYHLASRMRQEQGPGKETSLISGTWEGEKGEYKGLYNYFNVNAYGETTTDIIVNGLKWAQKKGWTNPQAAIYGGAELLANDYIKGGQDTLYLQKFDVVDGGDGYYSWQYMTNVSATKSEAEKIREAYRNMGMLSKESKIKFKIPVYKNMPTDRCPLPGLSTIVTENVEVNADKAIVRGGKGTTYSEIANLTKGTKILRIELDSQKDKDGIYWDKVVVGNHEKTKIGYLSRELITKITDITNSNEKYIVSSNTNFRNGPGTQNTTIIKLLSAGQVVTVIEKDQYKNVNKEDWYRVKLSDGTQGYVGAGYIEPYNENSNTYDRVKVVCSDGINIRKEPGKNAIILKAVAQGTILTRTQKESSTKDDYTWDKVTTSSGIVGYVVREDPKTKKQWIESLTSASTTTNNTKPNTPNSTAETTTIIGTGFKTNETQLVCQPNITVENIQKVAKDAVIKKDKETIVAGNVGTGYTVTYNGKTYTIVVKGDVTGTGTVTTLDAARVLKNAAGKYSLENEYLLAADVTEDGKVTTLDAARILKIAAGKLKLEV